MSAHDPGWLLERMLAIPSPSGHEAALASFLAERMRELGFEVRVDAAGNVVGEIGDVERPRILLLGHLDTVPGQLAVSRRDGRLYGRGAVDAKGPLAALVCAAAASRAPARLVVAGAVEEEVPQSRGSRHLVASQPAPDAVVVGEPTGWCGVTIGYKGRAGIVYDVSRPPCHSSSPGEKAVEVAVAFWLDVRRRLEALGPDGAGIFDTPTATLIRLHGDTERARAEITCRVPPGFDFDALEAFVAAASRGGTAALDERTPAVRRDRRDPVARALAAAIRGQGGTPRLKVKTGTSDMNVVAPAWPVPMAAYGPGDSSLDHTPDEHVDIDELERCVSVLGAALPAIAEAVAPPPDEDGGLSDGDERLVAGRLRALGYLE